jgi:hypothetical protein
LEKVSGELLDLGGILHLADGLGGSEAEVFGDDGGGGVMRAGCAGGGIKLLEAGGNRAADLGLVGGGGVGGEDTSQMGGVTAMPSPF